MARFSQMNYVAIAATLRELKPHSADKLEHWQKSVQAFAAMFAVDNPAFKREKFLNAVGYHGAMEAAANG